MEASRLLVYVYKIIGFKLLLVLYTSITLYSATSAYIEALILDMLNPVIEPPSPEGYNIMSFYSGLAVSPLTGLVDERIEYRLRQLQGAIVWSEVTVPVLANDTPVVLRGVDDTWAIVYKPRLVQGDRLDLNSTTRVWIGYKLAGIINVKPGDILVLKPLFTRVEALVQVAGIIESVEPYDNEIVASRVLASTLRGSMNPSTVRLAYDPELLDPGEIARVVGAETPPGLFRVASALVYGGYVRVEDPGRLQEYYIQRLGVPREAIVIAAITSNLIVSLLNIIPAWLVYSVRRRSFKSLIEQGVESSTVRLALALATIPLVLLASITGIMVAGLLEPPVILGYPLGVTLGFEASIAHVAIQVLLYTVGLITGGLRED